MTITDTGPGIPADERERAKQRFVRLDAQRSTPGSGLGLSLAEAVAKLHDARLELADNAPGLRVALTFRPASEGRRRPSRGGPSPPERASAGAAPGYRQRGFVGGKSCSLVRA